MFQVSHILFSLRCWLQIFQIPAHKSDLCSSEGGLQVTQHSDRTSTSSLHSLFSLRAKKVHDGVTHAAKLFPNAYIVMIAIGAIKGNGAGFVKVAERLCRGVWTPTAVEFLVPNL